MKYTLRKWMIPIFLFIGFMLSTSKTFAQKSIKLNLKEGIEKEKTSSKSTQKLVKRMDFYEEGENKTMTMYFEYDTNGRVIQTKNIGYYYKNFFENATVLYTINGKELIVSSSDLTKAEAGMSAICELNNMGYVEKTMISDNDGLFETEYFKYDDNGEISNYSSKYNSIDYSWTNGNLYISYYNNSKNPPKFIYTSVENKANLNFNRIFYETIGEGYLQLEFLGYVGNNDKNLLSSIDNTTFEYEYDEDGYVTKIKSSKDAVCTAEVFYEEEPNPSPDPTPDNNPTTDDELEDIINNAPEGSEDSPTEIFIPSGGITLNKPLNVDKHIRLKGGSLLRGDDNPYALLRIRSGYSLELDDISIDGNGISQKDGSLIVYGKLKLKDGVSIKNCKRTEANTPSGTICIAQEGTLVMDGGTIAGNIGSYGSAVYNEGTFIMSNGEISFNIGQIGAIVNNANGKFIMTGGKISSNKATEACGGIFVNENCSFQMTGGEIFGNESCALYTWSDLQIGGPAKIDGELWLNDGNRLLINSALQNSWKILYVDTPQNGTIVSTGHNGYRITENDLKKIIYTNDGGQLKLSGNNIIVADQTETGIETVHDNLFHLIISGNQVQIAGLPSNTILTVYDITGKLVSSFVTGENGQCNFTIDNGLYLLNCKGSISKFIVK